METWDLSCPDWEARLRSGRSLMPALPLNHERAERAVKIFNRLRLSDVPGTPKLETAAGEWFRDIVRALHGSIDAESGERYIREIFCLVGKKNSKTSYSALLMLVSLLMNERRNAEFLFVAPTQEIAELAFNQVAGAIELDDELRDRLTWVQNHLKKVTLLKTGAHLKIKSFDPKVMTGVKPAGVMLDELHVLAESPAGDRVLRQIRNGMVSQPEGFLLTVTTQSESQPSGIFRSELQKARAIRDGKARGEILPIIYEFPLEIARDPDQWSDTKNWPMVVPNLGKSITIPRLVRLYEDAKSSGKSEVIGWASQMLNIEVGIGIRGDRWIGAEFWESRADRTLTLDALIARCDVAVVGIDGGGLDDLLGVTVIGREKGTRKWLSWSKAFAHRIVLDRRKSIASKLMDFERDGDLIFIDEETQQDVEKVADIVEMIRDAGILPSEGCIGVDPVGVSDILDELERRKFTASTEEAAGQIVPVRQGYTLQTAIKVAERRLSQNILIHDGSPLMNWCVGNAKPEQKGNAMMITKANAGDAKIDPLMAFFNAVSLMAANPEPPSPPQIYAI